MAVNVRKLGDNDYEIAGSGKALKFDREKFEDIYYAIPEEQGKYKNETEFFRHLTDNICQDQSQRDIINFILDQEADAKVAALQSIQDQVRAIGV
ncbi:MAG: hypothetical protein AB7K09_24990 [Planctomycetota bacterium]